MSTESHNLSAFEHGKVHAPEQIEISIIVAEWNAEVTEALYQGAHKRLIEAGIPEENITRVNVPGCFELPLAGQWTYESDKPEAVICLGCLIQGETPHFTFISEAVAHGIMALNKKYQSPFIFGVLTTNTEEEARERAGGKHGNKGEEAAVAALKMIELKRKVFRPF